MKKIEAHNSVLVKLAKMAFAENQPMGEQSITLLGRSLISILTAIGTLSIVELVFFNSLHMSSNPWSRSAEVFIGLFAFYVTWLSLDARVSPPEK